jgi:flagellar basal-body rod protein FlgC
MSSILSIAASGLAAASQRLQVSAQNVANASSDGPLPSASAAVQAQFPQAYVAQQVNQVATAGGGTQAVVSDVQPGTVTAYNPNAPYADANGNVAAPNVDYANEAVQQMLANYQYAANAGVIRVASQMLATLFDIQV